MIPGGCSLEKLQMEHATCPGALKNSMSIEFLQTPSSSMRDRANRRNHKGTAERAVNKQSAEHIGKTGTSSVCLMASSG